MTKKNNKGAIVIIKNEENKFLLLLRPDWVSWAPSKWAFAGGRVENEESPAAAAVREVKEETELDINVDDLEYLPTISNKYVDVFFAKCYSGRLKIDHEHDDYVWVTRENLGYYELAPGVAKAINYLAYRE